MAIHKNTLVTATLAIFSSALCSAYYERDLFIGLVFLNRIWYNSTLTTYCISLAQTINIHFLGLFLESSFMLDDSHDNLTVEEDAGGNRDDIVEDISIEDKTLGVPIFCQVVIAAGEQLSLCKIQNSKSLQICFVWPSVVIEMLLPRA